MGFTRRTFLRQSLAVTCTTVFGGRMLAQIAQSSGDSTDLFARMSWLNEPASWNKSSGKLLVRSRLKPTSGARRFTATSQITAISSIYRPAAILFSSPGSTGSTRRCTIKPDSWCASMPRTG